MGWGEEVSIYNFAMKSRKFWSSFHFLIFFIKFVNNSNNALQGISEDLSCSFN